MQVSNFNDFIQYCYHSMITIVDSNVKTFIILFLVIYYLSQYTQLHTQSMANVFSFFLLSFFHNFMSEALSV